MKKIKLLIVFLAFLPLVAFSQQKPEEKPDDLQKVKDALVNSVLYTQELEKQNANLQAVMKKVAEDLKKIKTVQQLDSLKVVYGIEQKPIKK